MAKVYLDYTITPIRSTSKGLMIFQNVYNELAICMVGNSRFMYRDSDELY